MDTQLQMDANVPLCMLVVQTGKLKMLTQLPQQHIVRL